MVLAAGLLVTLLASALSFAADHRERSRIAQLEAAAISGALQTGLATPVESVHAIAAFMEALDERGTTHEQFRRMARPFLTRHPEIVALEWFPKVPGTLRERFESLVRAEQAGYEMREPTRAGAMVRAVTRDVHVPLVYSEPLNPAIHGLDIAFDPARVEPVWRALSTQRSTLSDPYELVEDPAGVFSVVAYVPVKRAAWRPGLEPALASGVVVGLYRLNPLFETALRGADMNGVALEIVDLAAPEKVRSLYRRGKLDDTLRFDSEVRFVDRTYRVLIAPRQHSAGVWPWLVPVAGAALTLMAGAYVRSTARARRFERRARQLGQYTIEDELAHGGMGTVYRARHALLRRPTAIKLARAGNDAEFEREALITCSLNHPNTVQLYDFGKGEDGTAYLAMEFIEGYNLEELVELTGPAQAARAVRILIQAAGSLAEAHDRGLLHGDVKPRNIMLTRRGGVSDFVKVLDFGLSRNLSADGGTRERFEGTPGFAAPEIVAGGRGDQRSDVFSLGCVAYFLLAARPAFAASASLPATLIRSVGESAAPLPDGTPRPLSDLVMACLAKSPEQRPDSMHTVGRLLREVLPSCPAWTQRDADDWWRAHPAPASPARAARPTLFSVALRHSSSTGGTEGSLRSAPPSAPEHPHT